jgi:Methylamine utilisation protein MauE
MAAAVIVRSLGLTLAVVFLAAAIHKLAVVRAGRAAAEPLVALSPWRRRHAPILFAAAAAVEATAALLLAVAPASGYGLAVVLLAFYTAEVRRLRPDQDCNCFGATVATDRAGALRRNLVLLLASIAALAGLLSGAVEVATLSQVVVGTALLLLAAISAVVALQRLGGWTAQRDAFLDQASPGKERM